MHALNRWWWVVAGVLLAISLKAFLVAAWVSDRVEEAAVSTLLEQNLNDVQFIGIDGADGIGRSGLNVTVEGPIGSREAAVAALEARDEIHTVSYQPTGGSGSTEETGGADQNEAERSDSTATRRSTSSAQEAGGQASAQSPMRVELQAEADGSVVLSGVVPDQRDREALVSEAGTEFGPPNVVDQLVVDGDVTNETGELILSGQAASAPNREAWLEKGRAVASAGGLALVDNLTVRSPAEQLNDLFVREPIEFDSALATIRSSSFPTLDVAAKLLIENPDTGRLVVVGHTDGDGSVAGNQVLSVDRAESVVAYLVDVGGVAADRLEVDGRGARQPLVEPEITPEDKQRNRRIEWELIP